LKVIYRGGKEMEGMDKMERKPIRIMDTTFRDGHQSSLATRMRTEDMVPIAEELDQVVFHSVKTQDDVYGLYVRAPVTIGLKREDEAIAKAKAEDQKK
jgi:glycine cleavage system pyridoxal-binding protein P